MLYFDAGLLVPSCDVNALKEAMMELITNPRLREVYGDEGRKRVAKNFTIDHMRKLYVKTIEKLITK